MVLLIVNLYGILRIPKHRAPNQQLTLSCLVARSPCVEYISLLNYIYTFMSILSLLVHFHWRGDIWRQWRSESDVRSTPRWNTNWRPRVVKQWRNGELEPEKGEPSLHNMFFNKKPLVTYLLLLFVPSILTWLGSYTSQVIQAVTFFYPRSLEVTWPDLWRGHKSPSQKGHQQNCQEFSCILLGQQITWDGCRRLNVVFGCFWRLIIEPFPVARRLLTSFNYSWWWRTTNISLSDSSRDMQPAIFLHHDWRNLATYWLCVYFRLALKFPPG